MAAVYDMVQERMAEGKYTGAVHYAKEIIKVDPNYRDIQDILQQAQRAKREQTWLLAISLVGAMVVVALTRWWGWTRDWQSLVFAVVGLLLSFLIADRLLHLRRT